ncbi:hypothetical protein V5799_025845 [Amblyomma americanum]|uniref:Uncharacterized protein n=1 Tax=Amblyomma americanum TaxID=6943 RepID=A0AAQ4E8G2_AMBAM
MREIRYQVKASSPRPSAQDRAMSTDVAVTKDTAVQPDKTVPDKVDRSQQMSDVPSLGVDDTAIAPVRKLVQMLEHKTASPVEKLTHQIVPKQKAANMTKPPVEKKEKESVKPELISPKDVKEKVHEKYDTSSIQENRGHSSTSAGKPLTFLRRIFSDSLTRRSKQAVARDPVPPLSETAKDDSQGALKSDSTRVTTNNTKCTEKTKEDGGSSSTGLPTSPKSGSTVISNPSTTRSLDFRDVLQKLIQQHAQNRTAVPSCKDVPLKNIPKQTPPQPSGPTSTASVSATSPALARTNFQPPKDPGKESPFILRSQEVTSNLSPMSPHFYATTIEESNMLCPAVQGKSSDERPTDGGELRCVIRNNTSPDSLKSSTTAVEESPPLLVRSFLDPHTVRDDGNRDETRVVPKQQARHGCSSDNLTTNAEKPSEVYAWGDSLSGSAETPSDQCRLEGYAPPNSPGNRDTGQAISLLQGLEATRTPAGVGLEQTYICLRAENDWNMTTPEAVLGSMDLEPSETSLGVLRATFKQSVDVTSRMPVHRDETTVMVHALKDKKTKGSKRKKRVNFEEEPFTVVLAEIEDGYSEPDRPEFAEELCLAAGVVRTVAVPEETAITPAQSRNLSVCDVMQVSPRPGDSALEQQVPPSPSGRVSPHSSPEVCSRPLSVVTSPDPLAATHHRTWGPSGEQRNVETIAEAVCQIELQDPQAIVEALGPKVSELAPGDIFSGDTLELAKSPVQIAVIEDINDHFVTNLVSEPGAENRVASHLWDAREHDLLASVKLLSAAVGTPESFSKSIGLPSSEGLRLSESSTLSSRVDGAVSSSIGCSVVLEPSSSAFSHARTGSPTSARSRRHSAKSLEVPCFESVYNSILQPGSSTGLSLSIPPLGSRDLSGICRVPERPRGSTSESSTIPCPVEDCRDGGAVPVAATTSKSTNLALRLTAPEPSEGGTEVLVPHATNVAAAHGEDCEESIPRTPHFSAEAPPRNGSRCSSSRPPSTTAILDNKAVVGKRLDEYFTAPIACGFDNPGEFGCALGRISSCSPTDMRVQTLVARWTSAPRSSPSRSLRLRRLCYRMPQVWIGVPLRLHHGAARTSAEDTSLRQIGIDCRIAVSKEVADKSACDDIFPSPPVTVER